jgi:hypothetical protein
MRGVVVQATRGRPLPDWAREINAGSWAQFFLKYIVSHRRDRLNAACAVFG